VFFFFFVEGMFTQTRGERTTKKVATSQYMNVQNAF